MTVDMGIMLQSLEELRIMNTPLKNMLVTTAFLVGLPLWFLIIAVGMPTRTMGMSSHGSRPS
jgi:hypothetical protein